MEKKKETNWVQYALIRYLDRIGVFPGMHVILAQLQILTYIL